MATARDIAVGTTAAFVGLGALLVGRHRGHRVRRGDEVIVPWFELPREVGVQLPSPIDQVSSSLGALIQPDEFDVPVTGTLTGNVIGHIWIGEGGRGFTLVPAPRPRVTIKREAVAAILRNGSIVSGSVPEP